MGNAERIRERIIERLGPGYSSENLLVFDTLPSTSMHAKELARAGAEDGTCVIALAQSEAKGKGGVPYFAPEGGLYLSMIMRPKISLDDCVRITKAAAVCVCHAIELVSCNKVRIKWVNDVYLGGRKVCGILTESENMAGEKMPEYVILGIGINLREPEGGFPPELPLAGALCGEVALEEIAQVLIREIGRDWESFLGENIIREYYARCFYV